MRSADHLVPYSPDGWQPTYEPEARQQSKFSGILKPVKLSHIWFYFCSLGGGIFFILNRTNVEIVSMESVICVVLDDGNARCWSKFPYRFNQKVSEGGLVAIQPHEYRNPASKDTQHRNPVQELAVLLAAMLIFSIFLSTASMAIALTRVSGFDAMILWTQAPDLVVLAGCGTTV
jgi:hypothetical protein